MSGPKHTPAPRDDTAELVELLARMTYTARILHQNAPPAGDDAEVLALITAAEAALARVPWEPVEVPEDEDLPF